MDDGASDANTSYEAHTLSSLSVDGETSCCNTHAIASERTNADANTCG